MAIQLRRGAYADFDPTKMVPAEVGIVTSGDPNTDDGKAAYVAFSAGNAKRLATVEDIATDLQEATDDAVGQATARAEAAAESVEASAAQITTNKNDIADLKADFEQLEPGLSAEAKAALLACFAKVAWIDEHGQDYYDALEAALTTPEEYPKITAVFVPGNHVVYSGSGIDTLKPYLTVKYFEDSSSQGQVLNDSEYSLSGALGAGSNRVEVIYNTLVAHVLVSAKNSGLPSGYTPYDYIRMKRKNDIASSAYDANYYANNQFGYTNFGPLITTKTFDDLFALNYHFKSKIDSATIETVQWRPILGGRIAATADAKSIAVYRYGNEKVSVHSHGSNIQQDYVLGDEIYDFKMINPAQSPSELLINDEVAVTIPWNNTNVVNYMLGLFTNRTSSDTVLYINNLYLLGDLEITNRQDEVVAHYIPVLRSSDGVIGIYDTVGQEFRTAQTPRYATTGNTYCVYSLGNWS